MKKEKILIVDDVDTNREILKETLQEHYDVLEACNGLEAIEKTVRHADDLSLILLDVIMPEMDGDQVLEILNKGGYLNTIPVMVITSRGPEEEANFLSNGAVDYINKPFYPENVLCRVRLQLELRRHRLHLETIVKDNIKKIFSMRDTLVDFLATVIEYRDIESGEHVKRTRLMAEALLKSIPPEHELNKELRGVDIYTISRAVSLHDIGKIAVPDNILLKPGKLTPEEFEQIKKHTVLGAQIIKSIEGIEENSYLQVCHDICLYHHERWDGKGYPEGKAGKDIPIAARIMSIVDVYDALTTKRVYKPAYTHAETLKIMAKGKGTQFDPQMLDIFMQNNEEFYKISSNPALN